MKRSEMKVASTACPTRQWTLEWREQGRWVKSVGTFAFPEQAMEHAEMIGAGAFGMIRIRSNNKVSLLRIRPVLAREVGDRPDARWDYILPV